MINETAIIITGSARSHLNATLYVAHLISPKYKVIYATYSSSETIIVSNGYEFFQLKSVPFGIGNEELVNKSLNSNSIYLDSLIDRLSNGIYEYRAKELINMVETLTPSILFIDIFLSTDFIILYPTIRKNKIKIVFIQTMLSTRTVEGIPLIDSKKEYINDFRIKIEHSERCILKYIIHILNCLKWLGRDDLSLIKSKFLSNKIPNKYEMMKSNFYNITFDNILELITAPKELEFAQNYSGNQYYLGNAIDLNRIITEEERKNTEYSKNALNQEKWDKRIYCAFGTLSMFSKSKAKTIIEKLVVVANNNPKKLFICACTVGDDLKELPINMLIIPTICQMKILPMVDLFITHAGLGSVKESIHFQIPMLGYPINSKWDATSNAAKIAYHGIGLSGDINKDTPRQIEAKIEELLVNPKYKQNITAMNQRIQKNPNYLPSRILEIIENSPYLV